jgi:hypothetical protein
MVPFQSLKVSPSNGKSSGKPERCGVSPLEGVAENMAEHCAAQQITADEKAKQAQQAA